MLRNIFSLGLLTLAIGTTVGCGKRADDPQPNCCGGTVVGATCMNGVLIDVDPAQAIGAPAYRHGANGDVCWAATSLP